MQAPAEIPSILIDLDSLYTGKSNVNYTFTIKYKED